MASLSAVPKPTGLRVLRQDPRWADKTTSSGKPPRHHPAADTTAASRGVASFSKVQGLDVVVVVFFENNVGAGRGM